MEKDNKKAEIYARRLELYNAGKTDSEIAREEGRHRQTVRLWRQTLGLPLVKGARQVKSKPIPTPDTIDEAGLTAEQRAIIKRGWRAAHEISVIASTCKAPRWAVSDYINELEHERSRVKSPIRWEPSKEDIEEMNLSFKERLAAGCRDDLSQQRRREARAMGGRNA